MTENRLLLLSSAPRAHGLVLYFKGSAKDNIYSCLVYSAYLPLLNFNISVLSVVHGYRGDSRELETKGGALTGCAVHTDIFAMQHQNAFSDGKA